jgi:hypothetical protein
VAVGGIATLDRGEVGGEVDQRWRQQALGGTAPNTGRDPDHVPKSPPSQAKHARGSNTQAGRRWRDEI